MKIEQIQGFSIEKDNLIALKKMGHIYEICYSEHLNSKCSIKLLDKDYYMLLTTGEIKECEHIDNRSENKAQVSQSLKRLRDYINTNVVDPNCCLWVTLTYSENMRDTKKLYIDFKRFIRRFINRYGKIEYIVAMEPQGRGAWHCHCIIIFNKKAPYIPNTDIAQLWEQGFTKTNKLQNIDNIGAYLTAYLGDMDYDSCIENNICFSEYDIKEVTEIGNIKLKKPKKFVKGGRLCMYPPKFNIYRISRGIKKPTKEYIKYSEAKEKVGLRHPTYSKSIKLTSENEEFTNIISYEYYNTLRK